MRVFENSSRYTIKPCGIGGLKMEYNYESLKNTYASFEHPALKVTVVP